MLTSHAPGTRYYPSRRLARASKRPGERIVQLGAFANGSFGLYSHRQGERLITVWACVPSDAPTYICEGSARER